MPTYGGHRGAYLLLPRIYGCWRRGKVLIFSLEVQSVRVGLTRASSIVFLALYFLFLWIAWILAVWITEPKSVEPPPASSSFEPNPTAAGRLPAGATPLRLMWIIMEFDGLRWKATPMWSWSVLQHLPLGDPDGGG